MLHEQIIRATKEVCPMKNIQIRMMVSNAARTGMRWLNLNLSRRAPAINLDRQFIIPLTPAMNDVFLSYQFIYRFINLKQNTFLFNVYDESIVNQRI